MALEASILSMSSSHSSCTTCWISAKVGSAKSGWYSPRITATHSVTLTSVSVIPSMFPSRSCLRKVRIRRSISAVCVLTVASWSPSRSATSCESVSGQPISTASAYSSEARCAAVAMPSSICTRNT